MIILDTDHLTTLKYANSDRFARLAQRLAASPDQEFATTAVTLEEQLRGWLSQINRFQDPVRQIPAYAELSGLIEFFSFWTVLPFDAPAAQKFTQFRQQKIRIGTMDLKIASIAVSRNALLLTANTRDFEVVPGLRIEDWIN
jgi:tRNA(fMet)-specific endonuclease VapC